MLTGGRLAAGGDEEWRLICIVVLTGGRLATTDEGKDESYVLLRRVVLLLGEVRRGGSWHFGMRKRVGRFYPKGKYSSMVWCYGYLGGRKLTWRKWREGTYSTEWICGECWSCWQERYVGILVFYWKKRRDRHEAAHLFSYSVFCFAMFCFSVGVLIFRN